jgi:NADH-quinone oxidoreductase subunit G
MVTLTIDGNEVQVAEGTNLIEAAARVGIEIPTYCYHPGLSVVGQCRICFVEIEGMPRLVTACSTPVRDGMVVLTGSDKVREARAAVMELLLENHPLDCPVCDQAGECFLQDYSVEHGLDTTHMVDERRTFKGMERRQLGPHVIQNQNRCIHCTRCVRFTREIAETYDLAMKSRGNHAYIDTFDSGPLENPFSACVADVCPVGALTVKEFRFRARVWHLDETESICPGCSIGCNITVGHLKGTVHRFVPRHNPEINGWWMCDYGRFLSEGQNARDIDAPRSDGEEIGWRQAIEALKELVAGAGATRVVASANMSNEGLLLVRKILNEHAGLEVVVPVDPGEPRKIKNGRKEWVEGVDGHPNSTGAKLLGLKLVDQAELESFVMTSSGPLIVLDSKAHPWLATEAAAQAVANQKVAICGRLSTPLVRKAALVLPAASWIEMEGTYTSSTGRVQLARRGIYPRGNAKPVWEVLALLAAALDAEPAPAPNPRAVFEALVEEFPAFAGMTYRRLATEPGIPVLEEVPNVG